MPWIDNPVYHRETALFQRGKTQVLLFIGGPLVLGGVFILHYMFSRLQELQQPITLMDSRPLFELQVVMLFWGLVFLAPALVGNSVHKDVRSGTLSFLRMTRMNAWEILAGKCLAYTTFYSMIFLTILPVLGMAFLVGGVSPSELLGAFFIILVAAVQCSLFAMITGLLIRRSATALAAGMALTLLYVLLPPFLSDLLDSLVYFLKASGFQWTFGEVFTKNLSMELYTNGHLVFPSLAVAQILSTGAVPTVFLGSLPLPFWTITVGTGIMTSTLSMMLAAFLMRQEWWLRRSMRTVARRGKRVLERFSSKNLLDERKNPFLDWELKKHIIVRSRYLVWGLCVAATLLISLFFSFADAAAFRAFATLWLGVTALLVMLIPIFYASQTVVKEKEQGTYDSLILTMLQPKQVIASKIKAGLLYVLPLLGVSAVVVFYCHALPDFKDMQNFAVQTNFIWWTYQFLRCVYYTILGTFFSLYCKTSLRALTYTIGADVLLTIPYLFFMGVFACCGGGIFFHFTSSRGFPSSPIVSMGTIYIGALMFHGIQAVYLGLIMRALYDRSINLMRFEAYRR